MEVLEGRHRGEGDEEGTCKQLNNGKEQYRIYYDMASLGVASYVTESPRKRSATKVIDNRLLSKFRHQRMAMVSFLSI